MTPSFTLDFTTPDEGSVTLTWDAYTGPNFARYVVLRTSSMSDRPDTPTYTPDNTDQQGRRPDAGHQHELHGAVRRRPPRRHEQGVLPGGGARRQRQRPGAVEHHDARARVVAGALRGQSPGDDGAHVADHDVHHRAGRLAGHHRRHDGHHHELSGPLGRARVP